MLTRCQDSVTVCGITNMPFVVLHTLQKVRIQFQGAPRNGNDVTEKLMKHFNTHRHSCTRTHTDAAVHSERER